MSAHEGPLKLVTESVSFGKHTREHVLEDLGFTVVGLEATGK